MWFPPPRALAPRLLARLPERHRNPRRTTWADANKGGAEIDSFLEGPCFDSAGNLHVVDIPYGRVFRVGPTQWPVVAEYEGWPNGLALGTADSLLVADYRHGLLSLDPASGAIAPLLETVASEGFRGLNDVATGPGGQILVTDQGQTGMQDPTGRVWRLWPDGRVDKLLGNGPSPNGIVLNRAATHCYVAMTRSCEVWRFALRDDAFVAKAGVFFRTPAGISGPDGMAVDAHDRLFVANPGHGVVWGVNPFGVPVLAIDCSDFGRTPTNVCLAPDGTTLLITEADSGSVLSVELPGVTAAWEKKGQGNEFP